MRRCFVDNIDDIKKFWLIDFEDTILYTIYGDAGEIAQYRSSKFDTKEECLEAVEKKIKARLKKKEVEVDEYTDFSCNVGAKNYFTKALYHSNFTKHFTNDIYYQKNLELAPFDKSIGIEVLDYGQSQNYTHLYKGLNYDFSLLPAYLIEEIWKYDKYVDPICDDFKGLDNEMIYASLVATYCSAFTQIRISGKLDSSLKQRALAAIRIVSECFDEKITEEILKPMHIDLFKFLAEGETIDDIKSSVQISFEKNMKFLNAQSYENSFFEMLFTETDDIKVANIGKSTFPTGKVVIADPIAYLGTNHQTILEKTIPIGTYNVVASVGNFSSVGARVIASKLVISEKQPVKFSLAEEDVTSDKENILSTVAIDTTLASFCDIKTSEEYLKFRLNWHAENEDKNIYTDYFSEQFINYSKNYKHLIKREDFFEWTIDGTDLTTTMFATGIGDGIYSAYWAYDENDEICQLVMPFMNPEFFR